MSAVAQPTPSVSPAGVQPFPAPGATRPSPPPKPGKSRLARIELIVLLVVVVGAFAFGAYRVLSADDNTPSRDPSLVTDAGALPQFSIRLPLGWVRDIETGQAIIDDLGITGVEAVYFAGHITQEGYYDPNLLILVEDLPAGYTLEDFVDDEVSAALLDTPDAWLAGRSTRSIAGRPAEVVLFVDPPDELYPEGYHSVQAFLLNGQHVWQIQCGGSSELTEERNKCAAAIDTFQFTSGSS